MLIRAGALVLLPLAIALACGGKSSDDHGGSGGADGGVAGHAGASAPDAGSATSCDELKQQYASLLVQARKCDPANPGVQCSALVDTDLACPCPTFANTANAEALQKLADLKLAWTGEKCWEPCPAATCQSPAGADCQPGKTGSYACFDYILE